METQSKVWKYEGGRWILCINSKDQWHDSFSISTISENSTQVKFHGQPFEFQIANWGVPQIAKRGQLWVQQSGRVKRCPRRFSPRKTKLRSHRLWHWLLAVFWGFACCRWQFINNFLAFVLLPLIIQDPIQFLCPQIGPSLKLSNFRISRLCLPSQHQQQQLFSGVDEISLVVDAICWPWQKSTISHTSR